MGSGGSKKFLTESDLEMYQLLTFLSEEEIVHCSKKYVEMFEDEEVTAYVKKDGSRKYILNLKLPQSKFKDKMPEFKVNPFGERLLRVFTQDSNRTVPPGKEEVVMFEDYLNMVSILGSSCPSQVKAKWAFKVYDFDSNEVIDAYDIRETVEKLTGYIKGSSSSTQLDENTLQKIVKAVQDEIDINENKEINSTEFEHIVTKSPEFINSFNVSF